MTTIKKLPNAFKWTEDRVSALLTGIEKEAIEEDSTLGMTLIRHGLYGQVWQYWKKVFAHHEDIMERIHMIDYIFETKLSDGALRRKYSSNAAAFVLRYCYHWTDRPEPVMEESPAEGCQVWIGNDCFSVTGSERRGFFKKVSDDPTPPLHMLTALSGDDAGK